MPDPSLRRRTAVGVGVVGALGGAAGCGTRGAAPAVAATDSDVVDQARAELATAADLVVRTMRAHPPLRSRLRPVLALHRRHAEVLAAGGSDATPSATVRSPATDDTALAGVLREEQRLQEELVALALRARSGPLARILAGMAAGTAQRRAVLADVGYRMSAA